MMIDLFIIRTETIGLRPAPGEIRRVMGMNLYTQQQYVVVAIYL